MSLSELCVRRPVFATMLVTTLVVLGLFSFRDLGVELFPRADPATVTVTILPARRQPRRSRELGRRADRRSAQQHRRHRRDDLDDPGRQRADHDQVRARARARRGGAGRAREGRAGDALPAAAGGAADHREGGSGFRAGLHAGALVGRHEPARADRGRRQGRVARAPDRGRRRRGDDVGRARPRDPHRHGHREAERVRADGRIRCGRPCRRRTSRSPAASCSAGSPK